jgi:hypothetical protein
VGERWEAASGAAPSAEEDSAGATAQRVLYCVPGAWTDAWFDDPRAWWAWGRAFLGWSDAQWQAFYGRWRTAPDRLRQEMMARSGLWFFDWQRVPGGSIRGSTREAAGEIAADLARLPRSPEVTLLGHSKGGSAIKALLAVERDWDKGARPARAILVDAPVDWLREVAGRLMGLGLHRVRLSAATCSVPCVTVNNWLDPSGGRLAGFRNYQTLVWQDYITPYPPHGLKSFLAERVLREVGALPVETPVDSRAR